MHRRRLLGLAGVTVLAMVLVATAGAGAEPAGARKVDLSTRAAVAKYLHSIGVNPKGVVIQRGRLNYAGPRCPGPKWTCTRSHRVVQVSEGGENSFQCTDNTVAPPDCVIVQSSPKKNKAVCREHIETNAPTADEHCSIDQTGPDNQAKVEMMIVMHGSPSQSASQNDQVTQQNFDATQNGHNDSDVRLRIVQVTGGGEGSGGNSAALDTSSQDQQTQQDTSVDQSDVSAGTNDSEASSTFLQVAKAGPGTTSQTQNTSNSPNNTVAVSQNNNGGRGDSDLTINGRSIAIGPGGDEDEGSGANAPGADVPTLHQTQGSPFGGLSGQNNQSAVSEGSGFAPSSASEQSSPLLTLDARINEAMIELGDPATTVQEQHGPTVCCSFQTGNPQQDHETIRENIHLFKNSDVGEQTDLNLLNCHSDNLANGCDGTIHTNVNGNMATASCFGNNSPCEIGVACTTVGSETGACVPASCDNLSEAGACPSPCDLSPSFCDEIGSFPSLSAPALVRRE